MKLQRTIASVAVAGCLIAPPSAFGQSGGQSQIKSFSATCKAVQTHGFRAENDIRGRPLPETWGDEGPFLSEPFEKFVFVQGSRVVQLQLLGRAATIVAANSTTLLAIDTAESDVALSSWSYLFNLKLRRVIATQVNGFDAFGTGVKARLVRLTCQFE